MRGITLTFQGSDYRIPEEKAFEIGERIEDIVTLSEVVAWKQKIPYRKVARCFGTMLRFAGCSATDEDVFSEMMVQMRAGGTAMAVHAVEALVAVLMDGVPEGDGTAPAKKASAS